MVPRPGKMWTLVDKPTPWGARKYRPVKVLEVRDDWVRYDMGGMFRDERMELATFLRNYRPVEDQPDADDAAAYPAWRQPPPADLPRWKHPKFREGVLVGFAAAVVLNLLVQFIEVLTSG